MEGDGRGSCVRCYLKMGKTIKTNQMDQLTTTNVLLMILGYLLQVLVTLQKVIKDKNFSFGFFVKDNWLNVPISLIAGFVGLIFAKDSIELLGVKADDGAPLYMVHAFLCGYAGREIVFRFIDLIKPRK